MRKEQHLVKELNNIRMDENRSIKANSINKFITWLHGNKFQNEACHTSRRNPFMGQFIQKENNVNNMEIEQNSMIYQEK